MPDQLPLALDGFEGPLDLLLDLARRQKVDLARISVLALADQFLAAIEDFRRVRVELAADWLVMAAWLAWLKSRLLLPGDPEADEDAEDASARLHAQLAALEACRAGAAWLAARPVLGQDVFGRGAPEKLAEVDRSAIRADLPALLRAYLDALRRAAARERYQPKQLSFWTVREAASRLEAALGRMPDWTVLERFLPPVAGELERRAALASTLVASLELARGGAVRLRQDAPFAPILVAAGTRP